MPVGAWEGISSLLHCTIPEMSKFEYAFLAAPRRDRYVSSDHCKFVSIYYKFILHIKFIN